MLIMMLHDPTIREVFRLVEIGNEPDADSLSKINYSKLSYEIVEDLLNLTAKDELDFSQLANSFAYASSLFHLLDEIVKAIRNHFDVRHFGLIRVYHAQGALIIYP